LLFFFSTGTDLLVFFSPRRRGLPFLPVELPSRLAYPYLSRGEPVLRQQDFFACMLLAPPPFFIAPVTQNAQFLICLDTRRTPLRLFPLQGRHASQSGKPVKISVFSTAQDGVTAPFPANDASEEGPPRAPDQAPAAFSLYTHRMYASFPLETSQFSGGPPPPLFQNPFFSRCLHGQGLSLDPNIKPAGTFAFNDVSLCLPTFQDPPPFPLLALCGAANVSLPFVLQPFSKPSLSFFIPLAFRSSHAIFPPTPNSTCRSLHSSRQASPSPFTFELPLPLNEGNLVLYSPSREYAFLNSPNLFYLINDLTARTTPQPRLAERVLLFDPSPTRNIARNFSPPNSIREGLQ